MIADITRPRVAAVLQLLQECLGSFLIIFLFPLWDRYELYDDVFL